LKTIIFANGNFSDPQRARQNIQPEDIILAADGGARHCLAMELIPHVVIGDFDSLTPDELAYMQAAGAKLIRYPVDKDFTDLELALEYAQQLKPDRILIFGGLGARWDQTLANLTLIAGSNYNGVSLALLDGSQEIIPLHGPGTLSIHGSPGDTVSLIPLAGNAEGITIQGCAYPLDHETLYFGSTRGVSNALSDHTATISLERGTLICIHIRNAAHSEAKAT